MILILATILNSSIKVGHSNYLQCGGAPRWRPSVTLWMSLLLRACCLNGLLFHLGRTLGYLWLFVCFCFFVLLKLHCVTQALLLLLLLYIKKVLLQVVTHSLHKRDTLMTTLLDLAPPTSYSLYSRIKNKVISYTKCDEVAK